MKYRKVSMYGLAAGGIIALATLLRLILIAQGWPRTNSDEGTMGIMALHIAYHGEHPIFYYGQYYMGSWEAFLGAGLFRIFGSSLFMLRLETVGMFAVFLIGMYFLTRLLFSRAWALVTLLLLGAGTGFTMTQELRAMGGYSETLVFSAALFLCTTWLALTYERKLSRQRQARRYLVYLLWGLIAGLGMWTDLIIIPPVMMSGLLILLVCWREFFKPLPLSCLILGLLIGAEPMIFYNLHAAPGQDSLSVLRNLQGSSRQPLTLLFVSHALHGTFFVSLPLITGEPFCPVTEFSFLGPNSPDTLPCALAHGSWSTIYLLLGVSALVMAGWSVWPVWSKRTRLSDGSEQQFIFRKKLARLLLLLSTAMSLILFTFSSAPWPWPGMSAHYLICLLVGTPAVLWPLWCGLQRTRMQRQFVARINQVLCASILLCFFALALAGSILAFNELPSATAQNQRDAALISQLEHLGVRHIYTDYWTCDKIAFESNDQIICGVLDGHLKPTHNRYSPYYSIVHADLHATYVFPTSFQSAPAYSYLTDPNQAIPAGSQFSGYSRMFVDGYVVTYLPAQYPQVYA